jgi:hypothetical protein
MLGTLVLMTKNPQAFDTYIARFTKFVVRQEAQERLYVWLGTIGVSRGTQPQFFDPTNYMHQREALLGGQFDFDEDDFKVGTRHGHRIPLGKVIGPVWGAAQKIANPADLLKKPLTKTYHFLAFTDYQVYRLFHGDNKLTHANAMVKESSITLGEVSHRYGAYWKAKAN